MKDLPRKIKENRYFLAFIFLFAYAHSVQLRALSQGKIDLYSFTPEAAVASVISACVLFMIIRKVMQWRGSPALFGLREALRVFGLSLLLYFLVLHAFGLLIALAFDNVERNFNTGTLLNYSSTIIIDALIYGSFYLAYDYYRRNRKQQEEIAVYHHALADSRISQLKTQLNPHFLFNNLNVLDQLIEEDKGKASDFLNEFADIYRYVLQATDRRVVSAEEELAFARKYFSLLQSKYGQAYRLTVEGEARGRMMPLSLQLLLENVFRHNMGTETRPVDICIRLGEEVTVSNTVIRKRKPVTVSGRGLANLKEQYRLLTRRQPEIIETEETFTVILPYVPHDPSDTDRR